MIPVTLLVLLGLGPAPAPASGFCADASMCLDAARQRLGRLVGCGEGPAYGVSFATTSRARLPLAELPSVPPRLVLLVHGLDDPGEIWRDVITALLAEGHAVARFDYPDDGPVAAAADLLAVELITLRAAGVTRIDVVAHSMGGLVGRDVLTRKAHYGGDGAGCGRFPSMERLILVATPNDGAPLAALHGLNEFKEHLTQPWGGQTSLFDWSEDGRGEAAADLQPGSAFLRGLNARPLGSHTRYTVIAGTVSPLGDPQATRLDRAARRVAASGKVPAWLGGFLGSALGCATDGLRTAARSIGDGVVPLDSAFLPGVEDVVILEAGHTEMILGGLDSERRPPAIAVIIERLGDPR